MQKIKTTDFYLDKNKTNATHERKCLSWSFSNQLYDIYIL